MSWKKTIQDETDKDFEARVLKAAMPLLEQNARLAAEEEKKRSWLYVFLPAAALGAVAIVLATGVLRNGPASSPALSAEMEIAMDLELFQDLREVEQLETLKALGDPAEWPKKLKKSKS